MVAAMRNFWIEGEVDGRRTSLAGGPRSKDGGFELAVYVRDKGSSEVAVRLSGRATRAGKLILNVTPGSYVTVTPVRDSAAFEIETER
jgi:hypothetical protein